MFSAFILSNELVNIWTHGGMIPLLIFTLLYDQIFVLPPLRASLMDHILFLQFMLCCLVSIKAGLLKLFFNTDL